MSDVASVEVTPCGRNKYHLVLRVGAVTLYSTRTYENEGIAATDAKYVADRLADSGEVVGP